MSRTLTSEELEYLSEIVAHIAKIRQETIFCGVSDYGIQVLSDRFVEQVTELDLPVTEEKTTDNFYAWRYSTTIGGCTLFCVSDKRLFQPLKEV